MTGEGKGSTLLGNVCGRCRGLALEVIISSIKFSFFLPFTHFSLHRENFVKELISGKIHI